MNWLDQRVLVQGEAVEEEEGMREKPGENGEEREEMGRRGEEGEEGRVVRMGL